MKIKLVLMMIPALALAAPSTQITIYNDGFATVKQDRNLPVVEGVSETRVTDMSRQLEPDSVIMRERGSEAFGLRILEQSFVNDPLTEALMLHEFEGKTVRFEELRDDGTIKEHQGRVIRSGYIPGSSASEQPIIESEGGVRFELPGTPVFEGIDAGAFLKPSLVWQLFSKKAGDCAVEISYITAGMSWEATYSLIAPKEGSDEFDLSGWISLRNDTGITFEDADIKLIAGDVQKVREDYRVKRAYPMEVAYAMADAEAMPEERAFDEFHLYTLPRPVLLRQSELKQVEFIRAPGIKGRRYYTYNPTVGYSYYNNVMPDPDYGTTTDKKVGVRIEISNSETNNLGVPLPKGRLRLYRTDEKDGRREFTGENRIDHLPKNELLKLDMGQAFDLVGERKRIDFSVDTTAKRMTESFEIKLRNRKEAPVEINVVESLYRAANWKITDSSIKHRKVDANLIEFIVPVAADSETILTYTVNYSW